MARVFIGYREVAGYFGSLAEGFEALGHTVTFAELHRHPFAYRPDRSPWILRRLRGALERNPKGLRTGAWKLAAALWIALRHEVIVISALESLFIRHPFLECRLARMLGRKIVFVLTGSDSRPAFCDHFGWESPDGKPVAAAALCALNRERAGRVALAEECATSVVSNLLSSQFCRQPTLNFLRIGFPTGIGSPDPPEPRVPSSPYRILHSPSHPALKGSRRIREGIAELRGQGFEIDYRELTGVPHAEVMAALRWCDLVIDQLYSDTPMAGLAREAASLGKAAVVCGYGWPDIDASIPEAESPPSFTFHPGELVPRLAELLSQPERIADMAGRAARFIAVHWSATVVAEKILQAAQGKAPDEWFFDPAAGRYFLGCGVIPFQVRVMARGILRVAGREGLCLGHVPLLAEALERFALQEFDPELEKRAGEILALESEIESVTAELGELRARVRAMDSRLEASPH